MSLILDALRKAEAERQRGAVPGLHTAVPPARATAEPAPAVRRSGWPLLAGAALLGAGAWAGYAWWPAAPAAPASAPAAAAVPGPGPTMAADSSAAATDAPTAQRTPAPPPAAGQAPLPLVVSAPPPPPPVATPAPAAPPADARATAGAGAGASPAPIITQVRRLADLPLEQRRELPPLVVGGSVWSEQAAARFVVLDGQVLREGDSLVPGLVLVKLAPRSATLRWRGALLEVPF